MNIHVILYIAMCAIMAFVICVGRMRIRDIIENIDAITFVVSFFTIIISILLLFLFMIFARPETIREQHHKLRSFAKTGNEYKYSYYDERGNVINGIVGDDIAQLDFYSKEPSVDIYSESSRRQFWIFYSDRKRTKANFVFRVMNSKDLNISEF